VFESKVTQNI